MSRTLPLLIAALVTAVGCECQESLTRHAPPERVELTATGLLNGGDATSEVDYNPPVYRIRAFDGGAFSATMTLGWGAIEALLPESPEARDPTRYAASSDDAFALVMGRDGMSDLTGERTVVGEDFDSMQFVARLDGRRYVDHAPTVRFALDVATGAVLAEVSGALVAEESGEAAGEGSGGARTYSVRFEAVSTVQCWGASQTMHDPPEWDSQFPVDEGPCADLRDALRALPVEPETPPLPWSLHPRESDSSCGLG